jgi:hypothetical protein
MTLAGKPAVPLAWLPLGLTLLVPAALVAQAPTPGEPPPVEAIEGRVRGGGEGAPLEEAWVEVLDLGDRVVRRTVTDSVGDFRVELPAPGRWRLRVSRRDFVAAVTEVIGVREGETMRVELSLEPRPPTLPPGARPPSA